MSLLCFCVCQRECRLPLLLVFRRQRSKLILQLGDALVAAGCSALVQPRSRLQPARLQFGLLHLESTLRSQRLPPLSRGSDIVQLGLQCTDAPVQTVRIAGCIQRRTRHA